MIEVLLVDDHLEPMKALARLVGLRTNLTYEVTDSLDRALAVVKSGGVKVAVLDQRLQPTLPMDGTKVFAEIRKIDHRVRGIIISGQSDKADLVELNALGMAYLDRGCSAEELAQEIQNQRIMYLDEAEREYERNARFVGRYVRRRRSIFSSPGQVVELLGIEPDNPSPECLDEDYAIVSDIEAGKTLRHVTTVVAENEVSLEQESIAQLESRLGLSGSVVKEVSARLSDSLRERDNSRQLNRTEQAGEESVSLSEADLAQGVVHRRVEVAPLYYRRQAILRVTCECCNERRVMSINLRQSTGSYSRRMVDTYRDQSVKTYDLGAR
ncbi:response regulator [Actinoplanes sp. NPDC051513]|uniref:response regulator n=1 Tax=Actinoplanes sp. NPDC051513 TaxID=3363908 RepID=UPI0037B4A944